MDELGKLFGSQARVRLLRLFLFNEGAVYDKDHITSHMRISPATAQKELASLLRAGVVKRKQFYKDVVSRRTGKPEKRKTVGWTLVDSYAYREPLTRFLTETLTIKKEELVRRIRQVGRIRFVLVSGIFTQTEESVLDLMIVGDKIDEKTLMEVLDSFEAELGRELRFTALTTADYLFRIGVRDRLMRDVLDYEHEVLLDRISTE